MLYLFVMILIRLLTSGRTCNRFVLRGKMKLQKMSSIVAPEDHGEKETISCRLRKTDNWK